MPSDPAAPDRPCPDENALQALAAGRAAPAEAERLQDHLADCEACRKTVAELVRSSTPGPERAPSPELQASRGAAIGRYVLVDRIGAGGMGVVYSAFDPELRRAVAVKLLRPGIAETEGRKRLVREAQAMARLSHPNVVAVYDVGLHGEQVFITMELLPGGTAREVGIGKRPLQEVLEVYLAAGRGLAHAHAAGIVHRDFKPGNVLVGAEGRVCVADFGLASELAAPEPTPVPSPGDEPHADERLTVTGAIVGTPAYLAPELRAGKPADARSDQFSFCVAAYEGLYGHSPFASGAAAARGEVLPAPRGSKVPARLRKALLRGLSADPSARFPDMQALLDALAHRPGAVRRRLLLGATAALAVAASAFGLVSERERRAALCQGGEARFAQVWSPARSEALSRAFAATGSPGAADTAQALRARFDALGAQYTSAYRGACEATRVRGEQSEELLDLRMMCLERWRGRVGAVLELFDEPDAALVGKAMAAVESIPRLDACADVEALTQRVRPPEDPQARARLVALQQEQARLEALTAAGQWPQALGRAQKLVDAAVAERYRPFESEARLLDARMQQLDGNQAAAEETARAAVVAALAGRDNPATLRAFSYLAWLAAWSHRGDEARQDIAQTLALLEGTPAPPQDEGYALLNVARAWQAMGEHPQACAAFERARQVAQKLEPPDEVFEERVAFSYANTLVEMERFDQARAEYERARTLLERSHGEPLALAPVLVGLGAVRLGQKQYADAEAVSRQALAIEEKELGPTNARELYPLANLCWALVHQGRAAEALPLIDRADGLLDPKWTRSRDQADLAFLQAHALWDLGRERPRALQLARGALDGYRAAQDADDVRKVQEWLATREPAPQAR